MPRDEGILHFYKGLFSPAASLASVFQRLGEEDVSHLTSSGKLRLALASDSGVVEISRDASRGRRSVTDERQISVSFPTRV